MSITGIKKFVAIFHDDEGLPCGEMAFKKTDEVFNFSEGSYNVDINATHHILKRWYWNTKYFYYRLNHPDPIKLNELNTKRKIIINPKAYNIQISNHALSEMNAEALKSDKSIPMKYIIIGAVILLLVVLVATGVIKL